MKQRKKRLFEYMAVMGTPKFPATRERKEFRLPWRVHGKGLKGKLL
jgi:hypothetical protein